uniref:Uncharacterized protein n=1 Tax=Cuerna arida TaxID=1464854 RepID=A0A1B6GT20_9HEMI
MGALIGFRDCGGLTSGLRHTDYVTVEDGFDGSGVRSSGLWRSDFGTAEVGLRRLDFGTVAIGLRDCVLRLRNCGRLTTGMVCTWRSEYVGAVIGLRECGRLAT